MKELSIEQKAKRYNEVIEKLRDFYKDYDTVSHIIDVKEELANLIPELKENEDERIRKELIDFVKSRLVGFPQCEKFIAWLEKQGKQKPILNVPPREVILAIWDLGNEWKELTNGCILTEHGTQLDYIQKHWHESEYYLKEKQGEKKPADKKPKFHEGEWITNGEYTWKIVDVKPLDYILQSLDGNIGDDTISYVDEQFHSFTIEDAKNGDVLAYNDGSLAIFRCRLSGLDAGLYRSHILLTNKIEIKQTCAVNNVHPATKEQRDTLMKAIADAGYTFDFEKKELKKIESKPDDIIEESYQQQADDLIETAMKFYSNNTFNTANNETD